MSNEPATWRTVRASRALSESLECARLSAGDSVFHRSLWIILVALLPQLLAHAEKPATERRFGDVTEARVLAEAASGENWLVNGGRFSGEHFSPLKRITTGNVDQLGLAWFADIPSFTMAAEPIVVDGVVYLSGSLSQVFALDARSGEMLWRFDPEIRLDLSLGNSYGARMNRGVAVWKERVYVGTAECTLIAIDASRGTQLWESPVCDPREGVGAHIRGAPRVGGGKVFIGYAGSSYQARSSLVAFDAATGKEVWRFWTVPGDPAKGGFETPELERASATWANGWAERGGGSVWEGIRYDPVTGNVFFGTGSANPLNVNLRGPGDALFTNSIMAVDAETGSYQWHYQTVPEDAWDYDAAMPLIVTDLEYGGEPSAGEREGPAPRRKEPSAGEREGAPLAGKEPSAGEREGAPLARKDSAGEREGEPLARKDSARDRQGQAPHTKQRRRVVMQAPKNGFFYVLDARTGELLAADPIVDVTWATHIDMETGRPVEPPGARYYANENPARPVPVKPQAGGAHSWYPMSFSPLTRLVYVPVADLATYYSVAGPYGLRLDSPAEPLPAGSGKLLAWDPVGREARWTVDYPLPWNSGVLSTAGELVFQGTAGGEFRAYRDASGELLWFRKTGTSILAAPVTFLAEGEQYVLAAAGIGGGNGVITPSHSSTPDARGPSRLFAFKLGGKARLPPPRDPAPVPRPPARTASKQQVEHGEEMWPTCGHCHGSQAMGVGPRDLPGAVPDLRYMSAKTHAEWHGIVLGGNQRHLGMPAFHEEMTVEDSEALHAYVIEQAWKLYERSQPDP